MSERRRWSRWRRLRALLLVLVVGFAIGTLRGWPVAWPFDVLYNLRPAVRVDALQRPPGQGNCAGSSREGCAPFDKSREARCKRREWTQTPRAKHLDLR